MLKLAEADKDLCELKDQLNNLTEEGNAIDAETPELEQILCRLDAKLAETQTQIDEQNIENNKRTQKCQEMLADAQQEYDAVCKEISEEIPKYVVSCIYNVYSGYIDC